MSSMSQQRSFHTTPDPAAVVIDAAARWVGDDDEVVLGCECANPALQIERWAQEAPSPLALAG